MSKKERILAVLSYLLILALVPIAWRNKSAALNTHIRSGIVILALWVLLFFVFKIPLIGIVLGVLLLLSSLVFMIWGIIDAAKGMEAKIPGVEKVADFLS